MTPRGDAAVQVLLLGGRSGAGKTSVAHEVSARYQQTGVAHCLVDGDNLDAAYPKPHDDQHGSGLTEANLRAVWATYSAAGYRRLLYVNTVSVLERAMIARAVGGTTCCRGVLLTATDSTARQRLTGREIGTELDVHLERSTRMADHLDRYVQEWVLRVPTDGRSVSDIAREVMCSTGWSGGT